LFTENVSKFSIPKNSKNATSKKIKNTSKPTTDYLSFIIIISFFRIFFSYKLFINEKSLKSTHTKHTPTTTGLDLGKKYYFFSFVKLEQRKLSSTT